MNMEYITPEILLDLDSDILCMHSRILILQDIVIQLDKLMKFNSDERSSMLAMVGRTDRQSQPEISPSRT